MASADATITAPREMDGGKSTVFEPPDVGLGIYQPGITLCGRALSSQTYGATWLWLACSLVVFTRLRASYILKNDEMKGEDAEPKFAL